MNIWLHEKLSLLLAKGTSTIINNDLGKNICSQRKSVICAGKNSLLTKHGKEYSWEEQIRSWPDGLIKKCCVVIAECRLKVMR